MKTIALVNQKGGVAKTTSTLNLAVAKAKEGKNVLMVDLDPQASLTISCDMESHIEEDNICSVLDPEKKMNAADCTYSVETLKMENLYILPSDIALSSLEVKLMTEYRGDRALKKALDQVEEYFDYCFIDCPPNLGILTINGLVAADEVIIPCKTDYLSYRGLRFLKKTIKDVQEDRPELKVKGVVATMYRGTVANQKEIHDLLAQNEELLGTIKMSADVDREVHNGLPVVISQPSSESAREYYKIAKVI